ncbi:MAG: VCBS repeat-containing protein [Planctomycetes bacterium]|nr:VCBS repeat-containing protein [Planctomycetota bacterium]
MLPRRRRWWVGAGATVLLGTIVALVAGRRSPPPGELLEQAQAELARSRYARAEELARRALDRRPRWSAALLVAGEAATRLRRYEEALGYYARIDRDGSHQASVGFWAAGELHFHLGRLSEAEHQFRRALENDSQFIPAHRSLALVLDVEGRRWEATPHLFEIVRQRQFDPQALLHLGYPEQSLDASDHLEMSLRAVPDDPLPLIGLARLAVDSNRQAQARDWLRKVVARYPRQPEAQARLGLVLAELSSANEFLEWHAQLPAECERHPVTWMARGVWAERRDESRTAVRCFWEAVRREPNLQVANYRLGTLLQGLSHWKSAELFLKRARDLDRLAHLLDALRRHPRDVLSLHRAVEIYESLGRLWEAWAWSHAALAVDPNLAWAHAAIARLEPQLERDPPRTIVSANPGHLVDLSAFPLPEWHGASRTSPAATPPFPPLPRGGQGGGSAGVRFEDRASAAGIEFVYRNGADPQTTGTRIFETTGGGVGVLDYDGDLWPDLYFTQGSRRPPPEVTGPDDDRLYRNLGNGRFEDVTARAGLGDTRFSQGVAVGDLDNDGFADLYVANIGPNGLYRNNGDGTFTEISQERGLGDDRWTTSCLIADLDGDRSPDLYDVNYVGGDDAFHLICEKAGVPHSCSPRTFEAAQDQVFVSLGSGRYRETGASAGIVVSDGYGLGVVAGDFDGSGRLSLFVANDEVPNFFFVNRTDAGRLRFEERALVSGLAVDGDGHSQACMGVAAGDADGDGLLDLFVTNFYDESNTLYLGQPGLLFIDATRRAGLRDPSFKLLGFGTQFLDADLDGNEDLVLTNGHIDDVTRAGIPYHMPPQFFRNRGDGRFLELNGASSPGGYFQKKYLGRGLARLDWNRDGREDFAVSHIDAPAALVTNESAGVGRFVAVHLRGTGSARDAVGATVRVDCGTRTWTKQLTAGDGYQASNQRMLTFGLGDARPPAQLAVRWPSGLEQTFENVPLDREVLVVEGRPAVAALPRE